MANEKTVKVTLKRSVGVRRTGQARAAKLYGPGEVEIPLEDARALGLVDENGKLLKEQQKSADRQVKAPDRKNG